MLVSSMDSGGTERVAANLVDAWSARGDSVTLLITFSGRGECFYSVSKRVKVTYLSDLARCTGRNPFAYLIRLRTLREFSRLWQPDVVVSFLSNVNIAAILACRGQGRRVIVAERTHPSMVSVGWGWELLRRFTYPWAARVVMLSTEGLHWLETRIPSAKGVVIPNPVVFPVPSIAPVRPCVGNTAMSVSTSASKSPNEVFEMPNVAVSKF